MQKYKLTIEYDGTNFSGWQIQPNAITVEQVLEEAFHQILQQPVDLVGQGRTDAGVHARGQVAHIELPDDVNLQKLLFGVNGISGEEIQIVRAEKVDPEFHARFDALSREYMYTLTLRPFPLLRHHSWQLRNTIQSSLLNECAGLILGEHDFAGFSKFNEDNYTTLCTVEESCFEFDGEIIRYRIRANRFLRNMVRRLVGTMVRVAERKLTGADFGELLENPSYNMKTYTAPAKGLILEKVFYKK